MDIVTSIELVQEVITSTGKDPEIIPDIATTTVDPDTTCTTVLSDIPPASSLVADPTNNNNNDTVTTGSNYNDPNLLPVVVDVVEPSHYQEEKGEEETNTGTSMNIAPPLLPVVMETETTHHPTTTTSSNTSTKEEDEETIMMSNIINSNSNSNSNSNNRKNEFDPHATSALQTLFREHEAMKEKVTKLKTLLGRSAKAQRDTKVEMEVWQRKYDTLYKENMKLQTRVQQLSARPTHLDLLADFETNFDRALLSVVNQNNNHHNHNHSNNNQIQSGGQDTSGTTLTNNNNTNIATIATGNTNTTLLDTTGSHNNNIINNTTATTSNTSHNHNSMDHILIQELSDAKKRIETLEQYNATLVQRSTQLEHQYNTMKRDTVMELQQKISHLELEKKMANMEVDHMTKQLQYNQSSLQEMQLEIELLHKQSTIQQTAAHRREVKSMEHSSSSGGHGQGHHHPTNKQSQQLILHLQEQVKALEEWAMASNHAKTIANDRIRLLEEQLLNTRNSHYSHNSMTDVSVRSSGSHHHHLPPNDHSHTNNHNNETFDPTTMNPTNHNVDDDISSNERVLDTRKASIVIGAGDVGVVVFELPVELLKSINHFTQRIVLRWRFDILQGSDADITFGIWKGSCMTAAERRNPIDAIIQKRYVKGGAGGEIDEHAFSVRQSCTVVWSNQHSWVRPRTIKYILEAIVVDD